MGKAFLAVSGTRLITFWNW